MDLQRRGLVHDDVIIRLVQEGKNRIDRVQHPSAIAPPPRPANQRLIRERRGLGRGAEAISTSGYVNASIAAQPTPGTNQWIAFKCSQPIRIKLRPRILNHIGIEDWAIAHIQRGLVTATDSASGALLGHGPLVDGCAFK
jgi:hypothetical protein